MAARVIGFKQQEIEEASCPAGMREVEFSSPMYPGLKLVVTKNGRKSYLHRYTICGEKQCLKIGDYPAMGVEEAALTVIAQRKQINQGIDPKPSRNIELQIPTLRGFCEKTYIPHAQATKVSWKDDLGKLNGHIYSHLGHLRMTEIKSMDIQDYLNSLRDKCDLAPATVNRHRALLSKIFKVAMMGEIVSKNPCERVMKLKENNQIERYLDKDELERLVTVLKGGLTAGRLNRTTVAGFLMLLFTGARKMEVFNMRWLDINFETCQWLLKHNKAGKARYIPLSTEAMAVLNSIKPLPGCEFVFYNASTGKAIADPRKTFKTILEQAHITSFRVHDLRHNFASQAVSNGATLYMVQNLLGHASPQTTQRYAHLESRVMLEASEKIAQSMIAPKGTVAKPTQIEAKPAETEAKSERQEIKHLTEDVKPAPVTGRLKRRVPPRPLHP